MKSKLIKLLLISLLLFSLSTAAAAQDEDTGLTVSLRRDFGYGGFGNQIQGQFTFSASGPEDLKRVEFFMDNEMLAYDEEAPFSYHFSTDDYPIGEHSLYAIGTLEDGSEIRSNELVQQFLSPEAARKDTLTFVAPVMIITVVGVAAGAIIPMLRERKNGGVKAVGEYGAAGGTVCPRCGFPFSRNFLSPNMAVGKLERCPHCGKWSIRPRASQADLAAAEERLLASRKENSGEIVVDEKDELKRALDDSRFDD